MMRQRADDRSSPYVGARAVEWGEELYGRDWEKEELADLVRGRRHILLHAVSGAGKTSLIQAGLLPLLDRRGFLVMRKPIRVNRLPSIEFRRTGQDYNRYLLSTLLALDEHLPEDFRTSEDELAAMTRLGPYMEARRARITEHEGKENMRGEVLIFDQFEESLSLDATDREEKAVFFEELGSLLTDYPYRALFVIRDDYVGGLEPYLQYLPNRLSTRFRLELLNLDMAYEAIQRPPRKTQQDEKAKEVAVNTFAEGAARMVAEDLAKTMVRQEDGDWRREQGEYVEPLHLQIVCQKLWDERPEGVTQIKEEAVQAALAAGPEVEAFSTVDRALAAYYSERVAEAATQTGVPQRAIRQWFDQHLITQHGIRGQVLQGQDRTHGLDNLAIERLVKDHLVRAEERRDATWYELVHDRLIEPVRHSNAEWYRTESSTAITIRIRPGGGSGVYPVEATLDDGTFFPGELHLELTELAEVGYDPLEYGARLSRALFAGSIGRAYERALDRARQQAQGRLRLRLWIDDKDIDDEDMDLRLWYWERICPPGEDQPAPLSTSRLVSFSRYAGLPIADPSPVAERPVRVLIAVSNPDGLKKWGLLPADVEREVDLHRRGLEALQSRGLVQVTLMPGITGLASEADGCNVLEGPTGLWELLQALPEHDVIHFVGHARGSKEGRNVLYLEDADGGVRLVESDDLLTRLAAIPVPHLVFLSSPRSADPKAGRPFMRLGRALINAGVPAVITMRDVMLVESSRDLIEEFYKQILEHGAVDRALNQARSRLLDEGKADWDSPVLFTRLQHGELVSTHLRGEGVRDEEEHRDLLIRIRDRGAPEGAYPVEVTADDGSIFLGGSWRPEELLLLPVISEQEQFRGQLDLRDKLAPGLELFDALFSGPARRAYDTLLERAETQTEGRLRFRLWIDGDARELQALPWENLCRVRGLQPVPVTVSSLTPFSRYTPVELAEFEPIRGKRIELLVAISNPQDLRAFNTEQIVENLHPALIGPQRGGLVRVTLMPGRAGLSKELAHRLMADGYDVHEGPTGLDLTLELLQDCHWFHFVGDCSRDLDGNACLTFEREDGSSEPVSERELAEALGPSHFPHLVFVAASDTAGFATWLTKKGVGAVVAFRGALSRGISWQLVPAFYRHLFAHGIVDLALNQARFSVLDRPEWALPVLCTRMPDGRLFYPRQPEVGSLAEGENSSLER
jgi:hypothetical protein